MASGGLGVFWVLSSQFCTQAEPAYCGLATLAMFCTQVENAYCGLATLAMAEPAYCGLATLAMTPLVLVFLP
ncbi:hypothetical protein T484DRAFT_1849133 [Baffinella frigidus]|nr:hypothetical protein T484DRAFT_1849133 [Cryptophyta sp. CCMP2293]